MNRVINTRPIYLSICLFRRPKTVCGIKEDYPPTRSFIHWAVPNSPTMDRHQGEPSSTVISGNYRGLNEELMNSSESELRMLSVSEIRTKHLCDSLLESWGVRKTRVYCITQSHTVCMWLKFLVQNVESNCQVRSKVWGLQVLEGACEKAAKFRLSANTWRLRLAMRSRRQNDEVGGWLRCHRWWAAGLIDPFHMCDLSECFSHKMVLSKYFHYTLCSTQLLLP